jgi:hypothetical protein
MLLQTFSIPTGDPDPDSETYERAEPAQQPPPQQEPTPRQKAARALWAFAKGFGLSQDDLNTEYQVWASNEDVDAARTLNEADAKTLDAFHEHLRIMGDPERISETREKAES